MTSPFYHITLAKSTTSIAAWRSAVTKKLDELISAEETRRPRRFQGSVQSTSIASDVSRRGSITSAAPLAAAATAAAAARAEGSACKGAADRQGLGTPVTPKALLVPSASCSDIVACALTPSSPIASLPQVVVVSETGGGVAAAVQPTASISLLQQQLAVAQQQLGSQKQQLVSQQQEICSLKQQLEAVLHAQSKQKQQVQATNAAGIRNADRLAAVEQQVQELLAANLQQAETRDDVSKLHSRQMQLQQRQQRDECQLSLVFKDATPLPNSAAATHLQNLLNKQLGLSITVQRVQQLGGKQQSNNGSSERSRHAYKVTLGSGGERTAVLRAKAKGLRGTSMSIDALLTPEQLTSKKNLMPVARQAKAAGQAVRWHYGTLLVDGKEYTGLGSLPSPAQQQTAASQRHISSTAKQPAASSSDGWQVVQRKQPKQPTASKGAPTGASKKQQAGSKGSPKCPQQSTATKQQQAGSGKLQHAGNRKQQQQQPAGGAGGAPACMASQGLGQADSISAMAQPVAGHDVGPPNSKPPLAAASGSSQQPPAAANGSSQQPPAAAGSTSSAPTPLSPIRA